VYDIAREARASTNAAASQAIHLPPGPTAHALARRFVRASAVELGLNGRSEDALLVAAELVSNAFEHASGPVVLSIERQDDRVRIGVTDRSASTLPRLRDVDVDSLSGRGLRIVDELSVIWGADRIAGGKQVWAELDL
jgi:anti-sigma regulatory factor (Ser/Thr protein kinase)